MPTTGSRVRRSALNPRPGGLIFSLAKREPDARFCCRAMRGVGPSPSPDGTRLLPDRYQAGRSRLALVPVPLEVIDAPALHLHGLGDAEVGRALRLTPVLEERLTWPSVPSGPRCRGGTCRPVCLLAPRPTIP